MDGAAGASTGWAATGPAKITASIRAFMATAFQRMQGRRAMRRAASTIDGGLSNVEAEITPDGATLKARLSVRQIRAFFVADPKVTFVGDMVRLTAAFFGRLSDRGERQDPEESQNHHPGRRGNNSVEPRPPCRRQGHRVSPDLAHGAAPAPSSAIRALYHRARATRRGRAMRPRFPLSEGTPSGIVGLGMRTVGAARSQSTHGLCRCSVTSPGVIHRNHGRRAQSCRDGKFANQAVSVSSGSLIDPLARSADPGRDPVCFFGSALPGKNPVGAKQGLGHHLPRRGPWARRGASDISSSKP